MKQSIGLIILQVVSILLGFFTVYYVAANVTPTLYAILGVQQVVSSIMLVFSNTGLETVAIRNILNWEKTGNKLKIDIVTSQSFFLRILLAFLLSMILILYVFYMSKNKFDGNYIQFFLLFLISGIFHAANDSMRLILKAHNKYFLSVLSNYFVTVFGKLLALYLFVLYGFEYYIYVLVLLPALVFLPLLYLNFKYIKIKYLFSVSLLKFTLNRSKNFAFTSYFSYFFNFADQLIVTILMPAEIIGVFTFAKKIFSMIKLFIENFFDPILQKSVQYKKDIKSFFKYYRKIKNWRNIFFVLFIIGIIIFAILGKTIISYLKLEQYEFLYNYLLLIFIGFAILILFKIQYALISLFSDSRVFLVFSILVSVITITSLSVFIMLFPVSILYGYVVSSNLIILALAQFWFSKEGRHKIILKSTI